MYSLVPRCKLCLHSLNNCCSWWCLLLVQVTQYPRLKSHRIEPKVMREWWRGRIYSIFHKLYIRGRLHHFLTYNHIKWDQPKVMSANTIQILTNKKSNFHNLMKYVFFSLPLSKSSPCNKSPLNYSYFTPILALLI